MLSPNPLQTRCCARKRKQKKSLSRDLAIASITRKLEDNPLLFRWKGGPWETDERQDVPEKTQAASTMYRLSVSSKDVYPALLSM